MLEIFPNNQFGILVGMYPHFEAKFKVVKWTFISDAGTDYHFKKEFF